jgi:hypothetical protein
MELTLARIGPQPGHRAWLRRWRLPSGDCPDVCPRLRVVGDPRKSPTQLDGGRQLALLVEDGADCIGIGLGDEEHSKRMAARRTAGKRVPVSSRLNLLSRIKPGQGNHPYKRAAAHELAVVSRICSEAGAPLMANEPHSDSSPSSPGQSNRREELIRIFDKLNDAGKQELLRLAKELARSS